MFTKICSKCKQEKDLSELINKINRKQKELHSELMNLLLHFLAS